MRTRPGARPWGEQKDNLDTVWEEDLYEGPRRKMDKLREMLEAFPPRCIGSQQTLEDAHRYAGKVELAQQLLRDFFPEKGE